MAGWERHHNWPSLISLRCLHESGAWAFIRASLAEGLSVSLPSPSQLRSGLMMNGCRDGLLPRESAWRARAKPWMMNNDSVAISPQEAPSDSGRFFYKGNPVDKLPLTRDRTLSRLGVAGDCRDSVRHHLLETGFIISSKPPSASEAARKVLFIPNEEEELVCEDFSKVVGGKKKKRKEEEAGEERDKEGERMKIKEHVCKLTLTAQQGARVDRGERWSDLLTQATERKESKRRGGTRDKTNSIIFSIKRKNLSLSSTKDPPGLNQLQTNLILRRDTGGINSSFQFNSAPRPGRGKLSSITFMCLARQP